MGIGTDRLDISVAGDGAIGRADKFIAQTLKHRLNTPILPKIGMTASRAKISNPQVIDIPHRFDFLPQLGHCAGIEHLQLEPAHMF